MNGCGRWVLCAAAGKTTFIKHILDREYPGSSIGPEPTTGQPHLTFALNPAEYIASAAEGMCRRGPVPT
eukprot:scaffold356468_cov19-Prasinocladus_malaysianus.AAC.1